MIYEVKRFLASLMLCLFSVCCLAASYYHWRQAKTMLQAAAETGGEQAEYRTEKVKSVDFCDELRAEGTLKSIRTEEYRFDPAQYSVNRYLPLQIGSTVEKGVQLCYHNEDPDAVIWTKAAGTVTGDSIGSDGIRTITVEDTAHLKACFYIPQRYLARYALQDPIRITYNEQTYPAVITFLDQRMTDVTATDADGTETTEKQLYAEAELEQCEGMHINADILFTDSISRQEHVMAVPKNAVRFEGDDAYVEVLDAAEQIHAVPVTLGEEQDDLVTVQAKGLYIGDLVVIG